MIHQIDAYPFYMNSTIVVCFAESKLNVAGGACNDV